MMNGAGRLFRIFVDVGTEAGEDGFGVCVRESELSKPNGAARFWARFVCRDMETLLAALDELQPDGLSQFVRETGQGPLFGHVVLGRADVVKLVRARCGSSSGHLTLLASSVSVENMRLRVFRATSMAEEMTSA
jgi:hypothetical protein